MPFKAVPVLYWDDELLAQSMSINRFLAKKVGLAGRNELEQGQVDMVVDHVLDIFNGKSSPVSFYSTTCGTMPASIPIKSRSKVKRINDIHLNCRIPNHFERQTFVFCHQIVFY